jgi:hypothetical protein
MIKETIQKLVNKQDLTHEEATVAMKESCLARQQTRR